jgi:hypothetical protein
LQSRRPAHFQVIHDQLAKLDGSTSATVLAAALDRETVSVEPIGGKYKLLAELSISGDFFRFPRNADCCLLSNNLAIH